MLKTRLNILILLLELNAITILQLQEVSDFYV